MSESRSEPEIRLSTQADAEVLARLVLEFRDHLMASRPSREVLGRALDRVLSGASPEAPTEFVLALDPGGTGLGYALLNFHESIWSPPREAWLEDLFVTEAARGAGLGRALLGFALERARARGATAIGLATNENNTESQGLYRKLGFEPETETRWNGGREILWGRKLTVEDA